MNEGTKTYATTMKLKNGNTNTNTLESEKSRIVRENGLKNAFQKLQKASSAALQCGDMSLIIRSLVNIGTVQVKLGNNVRYLYMCLYMCMYCILAYILTYI